MPTAVFKLRPHLKRRACDPESGSPNSCGFELSSVDKFRADTKVASKTNGAATPSEYLDTFINLRGASSAYNYIRYKVVSSYDPTGVLVSTFVSHALECQ